MNTGSIKNGFATLGIDKNLISILGTTKEKLPSKLGLVRYRGNDWIFTNWKKHCIPNCFCELCYIVNCSQFFFSTRSVGLIRKPADYSPNSSKNHKRKNNDDENCFLFHTDPILSRCQR